eukprot:CAMPEP_0198313100 /NCGR_PEP_ID=MMETSP1450-20131203/4235_1 /TAXON_ID=753684 ORGANISM="Madagascaria erythrocladiodes, Strain CCMP3234" /NCGR_SAMPLE_ID=MMETSP1450 /ASSEMBLY_ACC=CAM_ASM_001115 /LENGTH=36 /DNA_ID= /DNA_START= /DNA_END= /DNA_ORIENTATION=
MRLMMGPSWSTASSATVAAGRTVTTDCCDADGGVGG